MRLLFGAALRMWFKKYSEFVRRDAVVDALRNLAVVSVTTCYAM